MTVDELLKRHLDMESHRPLTEVETLRAQLETANQRIAEQDYLMGLAEQHRKELEQRAEEAERQLAIQK